MPTVWLWIEEQIWLLLDCQCRHILSVFIGGGNKPFGVCFPSHPVRIQLSLLSLSAHSRWWSERGDASGESGWEPRGDTSVKRHILALSKYWDVW